MSDGLGAAGWAKRLVAFALAVAVVLGVAAGGATVADGNGQPAEPISNPEYSTENVTVDYIEADGDVSPDRSATAGSGTVVIDAAHGNRFDRATIEPLVRGLTRVGYSVEFYRSGDLAAALEDAKAFVVIDPAQEYRPGDVDDVQRFTGQGGRLLVAGEPDRVGISAGLFGTSINTEESALTSLGSAYGASVDTAYLYNQESADANYKSIITTATDAEGLSDVERTTMYTAGTVRVRGGQVLLRSSPGTLRSSTDDEQGSYPVAVRRNDAVFLGDKTFMGEDRYRVADNEAFLTYLVEFLASGDRDTSRSLADGAEGGSAGGSSPVRGADPVDVD